MRKGTVLLAAIAIAIAACSGSGGGGSTSPTPAPTPTPQPTPTVLLAVQVVGPGLVTSAPPPIACPPTCSATFAVGTSITLTAVATTSGTFQQWFDVPCATNACALVLQTNASLETRS